MDYERMENLMTAFVSNYNISVTLMIILIHFIIIILMAMKVTIDIHWTFSLKKAYITYIQPRLIILQKINIIIVQS